MGGVRIVVAEDEAVIRMDLVEMLRDDGYDVVGQAPDGVAAVRLVEQHRPDAILVDVAMPGLDGIEVTRQVSDRAAVVVITAFGQRERVEQARDAGAMAYLVKPVGRADLMPAIEMAVSGWQTLRDLRAAQQESEDRAEVAEHKLADRRDVERAKGLVMQRTGLGEPEAYRWLQQTAMARRLGLADLAREILAGSTEAG